MAFGRYLYKKGLASHAIYGEICQKFGKYMDRKNNTERRKKIACTIYMGGEYSLAEVAEMMNLSERTLKNWSNMGGWAKLRASRAITPQKLLDDLYMLVNEIVEQINSRDEHIANPEEATTISRLADAIKKMQTDVGIVEIVGVGTRFINWMRGVDLDKAKEMATYFDAFLKDQVK